MTGMQSPHSLYGHRRDTTAAYPPAHPASSSSAAIPPTLPPLQHIPQHGRPVLPAPHPPYQPYHHPPQPPQQQQQQQDHTAYPSQQRLPSISTYRPVHPPPHQPLPPPHPSHQHPPLPPHHSLQRPHHQPTPLAPLVYPPQQQQRYSLPTPSPASTQPPPSAISQPQFAQQPLSSSQPQQPQPQQQQQSITIPEPHPAPSRKDSGRAGTSHGRSPTTNHANGTGGGAANGNANGKEGAEDALPPTSDFVKKLFRMLEDPSFHNIVSWTLSGTAFVVRDMTEFTKIILPRLFKHSNFASFVRQLNKYDFHKVKNPDESYGEHSWTFTHPQFRADSRDALEQIKRKVPSTKKRTSPILHAQGLPISASLPSLAPSTSLSSLPPSDQPNLSPLSAPALATAQSVQNTQNAQNNVIESLQMQVAQLQQALGETNRRLAEVGGAYGQVLEELIKVRSAVGTSDNVLGGVVEYVMKNSGGMKEEPKDDRPRTMGSAYHEEAVSPIVQTQTSVTQAQVDAFLSTEQTQAEAEAQFESHMQAHRLSKQVQQVLDAEMDVNDPSTSVALPLSTPELANVFAQVDDAMPLMTTQATQSGTSSASSSSSIASAPLDTSAMDAAMDELAAAPSDPKLIESSSPSPANASNLLAAQHLAHAQAATWLAAVGLPASPGTIDAFTSLTTGTDCTSLFPTFLLSDPPAPTNGMSGSDPSMRRPSTGHRPSWAVTPRVLLVEDDAVSRRLSGKFLSLFGCKIDFAENGEEAVSMAKLNFAKGEGYDLVLMDIVMPKLDGLGATTIIREFNKNMPIIAITSNAEPNDSLTYYTHGMNDVLAKPYTKNHVWDMLHKHLFHMQSGLLIEPGIATLSFGDDDDGAEVRPTPLASLKLPRGELSMLLQRLAGFGVEIHEGLSTVSFKRGLDDADENDAKRQRFELIE